MENVGQESFYAVSKLINYKKDRKLIKKLDNPYLRQVFWPWPDFKISSSNLPFEYEIYNFKFLERYQELHNLNFFKTYLCRCFHTNMLLPLKEVTTFKILKLHKLRHLVTAYVSDSIIHTETCKLFMLGTQITYLLLGMLQSSMRQLSEYQCGYCHLNLRNCIVKNFYILKAKKEELKKLNFFQGLPVEMILYLFRFLEDRDLFYLTFALPIDQRLLILKYIQQHRSRLQNNFLLATVKKILQGEGNYNICENCDLIQKPHLSSCLTCKTKDSLKTNIKRNVNLYIPIKKVLTADYSPYYCTCEVDNCNVILRVKPLTYQKYLLEQVMHTEQAGKYGVLTLRTLHYNQNEQHLCLTHNQCCEEACL